MSDQSTDAQSSDNSILFWQAVKFWLKLGFISFGGPAGQISMMHQELVENKRWISEKRFLHALNYTMILPGPEAQQLATYIGWLMHGVKGGIIAGSLFVLPSLFILIGLTWLYLAFGNVPAVAGVLFGIKPAVTAIVVFAAIKIGSRTLKNNLLRMIAILSFVAIFVFNIAFPYIVISAGLLGIVGSFVIPQYFISEGHSRDGEVQRLPSIIDDHSAIPLHAKFSWKRFAWYLFIGFGLWLAGMSILIQMFGWDTVYTDMGMFFSKAAMVTFGGAYAVLPYVYQGGVEQYGWLTGIQMIDGLALGETTPGPLIMVVAYVGFVGGWTKAVFGSEMLFVSGAIGAVVATFFTFLPSFLFVLLGGPLVEATRNEIKFTTALTAITAAVVGVILNLATFFAYHVFWPGGFTASFEWFAAILCGLALIGLYHFKISVIKIIGLSGLIGLAYQYVFLFY